MSNFREFDRETGFLLPPSLDEWLPEQHLARFVVEVIDGLDLRAKITWSEQDVGGGDGREHGSTLHRLGAKPGRLNTAHQTT